MILRVLTATVKQERAGTFNALMRKQLPILREHEGLVWVKLAPRMPRRIRTRWSPITGLIAMTLVACTTGSPASSAPSVGATASPSATPSIEPPTPSAGPVLVTPTMVDVAGAIRLDVRPFADWVSVTEGSAWVAVGRAVKQFDARDGTELAEIKVPGETCLAMDVGFGSVWVGACSETTPAIVRIDAATGTLDATVELDHDLQDESSVAAGEGAVWAVSLTPDQVLMKIDPDTNAVIGTYPISGRSAGMRAGYGGVWIAQPLDDTVLRIDPADGTIVSTIPVGDAPRFMAVGEGSIWAMNEADGTVSRVDPTTNTVVATILVTPRPVEGGDIAVGGGSVWARVSDQLVARIDPSTNTVMARYGPAAGSGSVAAGEDAVWISAHDINAVWRLPLE